ncbi:MAG: helix-turn-helix transcriptional regulator [Phycisphaeraceae bacterium]|nr:helix-turn-helix transcriptional regulator [Phycisphaeraceae bacterium]
MRPDPLSPVFEALAHPARRAMLDIVFEHPGRGVRELAAEFEMSRIAVMKHLRVLESCGLIRSEKDGRVRRLWFNAVPIQRIYDRWTDRYATFWAGRMADIKDRVEIAEDRKRRLKGTPTKKGARRAE